jgi:hypothetical protein
VPRVVVRDSVKSEPKGEIAEYVAPEETDEELFMLLMALGVLLYLAYSSIKAAAKPAVKRALTVSDQVNSVAAGEVTRTVAEVIDEVIATVRGVLAEKYSRARPTDVVAPTSYGKLVRGAVASLFDTVSTISRGEIASLLRINVLDTVSPTAVGSVKRLSVPISIEDTVSPTTSGFAVTPVIVAAMFDTVSPSSAWPNSSGINPFSPPWVYQPANAAIKRLFWDFYKSGEVQSFFTSISKPSWYDNYAYFDGVAAYRQVSSYVHAIAVCVKPVIVAIEQETELLYVGISDSSTALRGAVLKAVNAKTLRIYDRGGVNYTEFSWDGDWIVVYVSWPEKVARVYDRNGNLLADRALEDYYPFTQMHVVTGNSPGTNIRLMIDWVTIASP